MKAFWDSSVLLQLIIKQPYSEKARNYKEQFEDIIVWWGTSVEIQSALARLLREGNLKSKDLPGVSKRLNYLRKSWTEITPSDKLREIAENLMFKHALRTGDSFQLASALIWTKERPRHRPFVCFDKKLCIAALELDFDTFDQTRNR